MAKNIIINNGTGSASMINGNYDVTANVTGYDNSSISPSNVQVIAGTNNYALTIAATGSLTLHVTEDGTTSGTPIVGATFIRTDSEGNEYGNAITTNQEGNAVMSNVPFDTTDAPTIYYKQIASDGEHEFISTVQSTTMTASTSTIEIENTPGASRTINLTDANYPNLPITSGTITFTIE